MNRKSLDSRLHRISVTFSAVAVLTDSKAEESIVEINYRELSPLLRR